MFALGCFDILVTLPVQILTLTNVSVGIGPIRFWPGWSTIHSDWSPVLVPKSEWSSDPFSVWAVTWDKYLNSLNALIFFLLFGLTKEARSRYTRLFWAVVKPLGFKPSIKQEISEVAFASVNAGCEDTVGTEKS